MILLKESYQKNMSNKYFVLPDETKVFLMQSPIECESAAIATCTQVDYDKVNDAMHRVRKLPDVIENTLYGNPLTVLYTLLKLGYWKKELTLTQFINREGVPNKTMMLVKRNVTQQHWVVFAGITTTQSDKGVDRPIDLFHFHWGYELKPKTLTTEQVIDYFTNDGPFNTCFIIYKCNVVKKLSELLKMWFFRQISRIKSLFRIR